MRILQKITDTIGEIKIEATGGFAIYTAFSIVIVTLSAFIQLWEYAKSFF